MSLAIVTRGPDTFDCTVARLAVKGLVVSRVGVSEENKQAGIFFIAGG